MEENYVDKEILEEIKKLMNYASKAGGTEEIEKPILVLAPKMKEPGKESTSLRVYAYGGLLGRIPTARNKKGALMSQKYLKYLPENTEEKAKIEEMLRNPKAQTREQRIHTLLSEEYLDLALEACRRRFTSKKGNPRERWIETELIKKYLNNKDRWIPIDMEFAFPKQWVGDKKKCVRPDIVIYDKNAVAFRMIELKCDNKSCDGKSGLFEHYQDAMDIIISSHRDEIIAECFRKMEYLRDYGIISGEAWKEVLESTDRKSVDLKFGCFFIGGKLDTYQKYADRKLSCVKENCSFLYSPDIDTDILKNCQMLSYDEFMAYKEEA